MIFHTVCTTEIINLVRVVLVLSLIKKHTRKNSKKLNKIHYTFETTSMYN